MLNEDIRINKLRNGKPLNLALGRKTGKIRLYLRPDGAHTSSIMRRTNRWIEVPSETLDNVVRRLKLGRVDFIKIDTEGAELVVLRGADDILRKNPHIFLLIELHHGR